jgi:hypothetical protein
MGSSIVQVPRLSAGATMEVPLQIYVPPAASPSATIQMDLSYYIGGTLFHEIRGMALFPRVL